MELLYKVFNDNKYNWIGLLALELILIIGIPILIKGIVAEPSTKLLLNSVILVCLISIEMWLLVRGNLPKCKHEQGIVLSFTTENKKQSDRYSHDFAEEINKILKAKDLSCKFDVVYLKEYKAEKVNKQIMKYIENPRKKSYGKEVMRLSKVTRGQLFIYGVIKERKDGANYFHIDMNSIVTHKPNSKVNSQYAQNVLEEVICNFRINEEYEADGFRFASTYTSTIAKFIVGFGAYISDDIELAYNLHKNLVSEFNKAFLPDTKRNRIIKMLKNQIAAELQELSKFEYEVQGDNRKALEYINRAYSLMPKDYNILLFYAYLEFNINRKYEKSLQFLNEAKKVCRGDYVWLNNNAFITMYMGKFELGLSSYKVLASKSFEGDEVIYEEVVGYLNDLIKKEPNRYQLYFILGWINYYKRGNNPLALEAFEEFLSKAIDIASFNVLLNDARKNISEIKVDMDIENPAS